MTDQDMRYSYMVDSQDNQPHHWYLHPPSSTVKKKVQAKIKWVEEQFGPPDDDGRWYTDGYDFWFRDEKDSVFFKLSLE